MFTCSMLLLLFTVETLHFFISLYFIISSLDSFPSPISINFFLSPFTHLLSPNYYCLVSYSFPLQYFTQIIETRGLIFHILIHISITTSFFTLSFALCLYTVRRSTFIILSCCLVIPLLLPRLIGLLPLISPP